MDSSIKRKLTSIGKSEYFKRTISKLTLGQKLSYDEKSFILSCAIFFLKEYEKDKRNISYADLAYYIFLKYSIKYSDYTPLYEFSVNFGFYPIVKVILENELLENMSMEDYIVKERIEEFKHDKGYIETLNQFTARNLLIEDLSNEKSYIAPTSFGKSAVIIDYIKSFENYYDLKIVVVVPTKSLLMQTHRMIQEAKLSSKIIIHDGMYHNENAFIAIFTQERALRLIEKGCFFDVMVIDEAHKIFEKDRGILISRLIQKNYKFNSDHKIIYLSPLIKDVENLKTISGQNVSDHSIRFNLKEPEFFEFKESQGKTYQYNRFVNKFYLVEENQGSNVFSYITEHSEDNNFLFENSPQKIELLARDFCKYSKLENNSPADEVLELKKILAEKVHKDYYAIEYLDYGVVYIHGQLPDLVKEYLEYKFKSIKSIKYIIANTVILEGMNLPIDTLFIFGAQKIANGKSLLNLIGRVNRLDNIFKDYKEEGLKKLLPKVHILNRKDGNNHDSKFKYLRSRIFEDVIKNPTLEQYDLEKEASTKQKGEDRDRFIDRIKKIQDYEKFIYSEISTQNDSVKKYFIENGINNYYKDLERAVNSFISKNESALSSADFINLSIMEKIVYLFLDEADNIYDYEFKRLSYPATQKYYEGYFTVTKKQDLKSNIEWQVNRFNENINNPEFPQKKIYIGSSYGDATWESSDWRDSKRKVYIDLLGKDKKTLINIAIVKLQIEDNFVSFTINKFIKALFDFSLITEYEYNLYTYGSNDKEKIQLHKQGLSLNLITRLKEDGQLQNISTDEFNNLIGNQKLKIFLNTIDDFYRFEINRFITIND